MALAAVRVVCRLNLSKWTSASFVIDEQICRLADQTEMFGARTTSGTRSVLWADDNPRLSLLFMFGIQPKKFLKISSNSRTNQFMSVVFFNFEILLRLLRTNKVSRLSYSYVK